MVSGSIEREVLFLFFHYTLELAYGTSVVLCMHDLCIVMKYIKL